MNRISRLFETKQKGILSVYFTAGFPKLDDTLPVLRTLQEKGIDMVEIGIPFSDPMADGVVIQNSSTQALRNGMNLQLLFGQLRNIKEEISIPLILMGYLNPVMQYGIEAFFKDCSASGVDGVIIPDLPYADYISDYKEVAGRHGVKVIMLITPETSEERIRLIDRNTTGFIYMVSSASVTGAKNEFGTDAIGYFGKVNNLALNNPRLIGFGIGNQSTFDTACRYASGAIVGSRFIDLLQTETSIEEAVNSLLRNLGR